MDPIGVKLALAYAVDVGLGDPRWLPHPVRGLGWAIQRGESILRSWITNELLAGWLLLFGILLGTLGIVGGILWLSGQLHPGFSFLVEVGLLFFCLSTKDLAVESWPVHRHLKGEDLESARGNLRMIVGRDTDRLSEPEIVRATVETIGESTMDGIIAPLFYAVLGGAPLAWAYKAVNTLDSMVGVRSARYLLFGRAAALVDSWMNYLPARITGLLIAFASTVLGFSIGGSLKAIFRDAWKKTENSLIPEAAMAGALGVQLGGTNFYQGKAVQTPFLGDPKRSLHPGVIPQAIRLMVATSLIGFGCALMFRWAIWRMLA